MVQYQNYWTTWICISTYFIWLQQSLMVSVQMVSDVFMMARKLLKWPLNKRVWTIFVVRAFLEQRTNDALCTGTIRPPFCFHNKIMACTTGTPAWCFRHVTKPTFIEVNPVLHTCQSKQIIYISRTTPLMKREHEKQPHYDTMVHRPTVSVRCGAGNARVCFSYVDPVATWTKLNHNNDTEVAMSLGVQQDWPMSPFCSREPICPQRWRYYFNGSSCC